MTIRRYLNGQLRKLSVQDACNQRPKPRHGLGSLLPGTFFPSSIITLEVVMNNHRDHRKENYDVTEISKSNSHPYWNYLLASFTTAASCQPSPRRRLSQWQHS